MMEFDEVEFFGGPLDGQKVSIAKDSAGATIPTYYKTKFPKGKPFSSRNLPVHLYEKNNQRMEYRGIKFQIEEPTTPD